MRVDEAYEAPAPVSDKALHLMPSISILSKGMLHDYLKIFHKLRCDVFLYNWHTFYYCGSQRHGV